MTITSKKKVDTIRFIVTPEERATIEKEAKKAGMSVSTFLRSLVKNWVGDIKFRKNG